MTSTPHRRRAGRSRQAGGPGRHLTRLLRRVLLVLAVLAAVPVLLVPVYALVNPPVSTLMLWRLANGYGIDYRWRNLHDIAPVLPATAIMTEDGRFCDHRGVDWSAVQDVIEEIGDGGDPRGASTITMQVAKNLLLWPHRSFVRKFAEVPLAYWIDLVWSKKRIMEVYLNIVEWGPGIYGAEAAARHHFGKSARALSAREAALLAAVLPNPVARSAGRPNELTRRLAERAQARGALAGAYIGCLK